MSDKQTKLWRAACRMLYGSCQEGGKRGRPMDLIPRVEWQKIVAAIDRATEADNSAAAREPMAEQAGYVAGEQIDQYWDDHCDE